MRITAHVEMRSTEDGGRQHPFVAGGKYRPMFRISGGEGATGLIVETIISGSQITPGGAGTVEGDLLAPQALSSPVAEGTAFVLTEGPREVGFGTVLKIWGSDR